MILDVKLILFYFLSAIVITSSLSVILVKHPVKSVLSLVLAFVASSGLWLLAQAEFLALALIVVYVGAVMVLFLFVVMMLDVDMTAIKDGFNKYLPMAIILAVLFFSALAYTVTNKIFNSANYPLLEPRPENYSNITELGAQLYSKYIYSFELAGALLMVAIIAAIALAFRGPKQRHNQDINKQVKVRKKDRLKIIKM